MNYNLASTLGEIQTKIYWLHDAEKFAELAEAAATIYTLLGYEQEKAQIAGDLISQAYQLSDDADIAYKSGNFQEEIKYYNLVKEKLVEAENILNFPTSIAEHQMKWWLYFRHRDKLKVALHLFLQHFKPLGITNLLTAIQLTYCLIGMGKGHNLRDIAMTEKYTIKYWRLLLKLNIKEYPYLG
ncbi:MAG TPA: hypothetical protein VK203_25100 [Nostocaceae cyanobacterium]|nr:hypothetical protein [Nostocaceae cyanobacterium]